jgi:hypothetical protein
MVRTGLVVLAAVLTEFVIVAGSANQWVAKNIASDAIGRLTFWHLFEQSWLTYGWRFSPQSNASREWGAQLALDITTFVISGLLLFVLVRASVATFWRVLFATWLSVVAATLFGAFIRALILPSFDSGLPGSNRLTRAVFGPAGPGQLAVVSSLTLGLLAGLIAGFVAVQTRRHAGQDESVQATAAMYVPPDQPPPYYGEHPSGAPAAPPAGPPWQDQRYEPRGRHSTSPPQAPVHGDQPTPFYQPAPPPPAYQSGQQTTQLPRAGDDDPRR